MCLVASGCVEAYYEMGMHVWDLAAASLLVSEAGGVLMDVEGKDPRPRHPLGPRPSALGPDPCLSSRQEDRSTSCPGG